jgi:hypothetical protein
LGVVMAGGCNGLRGGLQLVFFILLKVAGKFRVRSAGAWQMPSKGLGSARARMAPDAKPQGCLS